MFAKLKAYTLVELLVVMIIIGLLAAFGIPAFLRYGRHTEANQKAEEIRSLFDEAKSLSLNPENTLVTSYRVYYDNTDTSKPKYILKSCFSDGSDNCASSKDVREVVLLEGESLIITTNNGLPVENIDLIMECSTKVIGGKTVCVPNQNITDPIDISPEVPDPQNWQIVMFTDYDKNVNKNFMLKVFSNPYKISIETQDL